MCFFLANQMKIEGATAQLLVMLVVLEDGQGLITFLLFGVLPENLALLAEWRQALGRWFAASALRRGLCCMPAARLSCDSPDENFDAARLSFAASMSMKGD